MEFHTAHGMGGVVFQESNQAPVEYYYKDAQNEQGHYFSEMEYVKEGESKFFYGQCPKNFHVGNFHMYELRS